MGARNQRGVSYRRGVVPDLVKVTLLGAGGMLGRAVQEAIPAGVEVRALMHADFDLTDRAGVRTALAQSSDWVINCAAWTRVDDAEDHERQATEINGDAVGLLGQAAHLVGARVLHLSTEYVFDGTLDRPYREGDIPNPQGAYGRSKLAGERALVASGCLWTLVRTQWLYGGGASFVRTMCNRARQRLASRVVDDQWGAPTHVAELATIIWRLVGEGNGGVWHAAAAGEATWHDVAQTIYALVGADPALVSPCSTTEYGAKAPRPANGRLDTRKVGALRPWEDVLREHILAESCGTRGP